MKVIKPNPHPNPCRRCESVGELYTQSPCNEASWHPLSVAVAKNQSGWSLPCPECRGRGFISKGA